MLPLHGVEDQAQNDPDRQHDIALIAEVDALQAGDRDQLQNHEGHGEHNADGSHHLQEDGSILVLSGGDQGAGTGEEVADGGADGAHIHEPAQRFTAQDRTGKAHGHAEDHGVLGGAEPVVDLAEPGGQIAVPGHGVHQTGGGQIEAHDTGQDRAGDAHAYQHLAEGPEQLFRSYQDHPLAGHHTLGPVGQGCGSHGVIAGVNEAAEDNGDHHNEADLLEGEVELLRSLGNGVKAHIGPGRNGEGGQDRAHDAGGSGMGGPGNCLADLLRLQTCVHSSFGGLFIVIEAPDGSHIHTLGLGAEQRAEEQGEHTDHQQAGQDGLDDAGLLDADDVQKSEQDQNRHGRDHLTEVDVGSCQGIVEAEVQDALMAGQAVNDQGNGGAVHGDVGQIGRHQEPAAEEGHPLAEAVLCEGELTAGLGVLGHHVGVGEGDDDHNQGAEDHGDGGAGHAGIRQELLAGIDEGAPADHAAEGDCPHVHGGKLTLQRAVALLDFRCLFLHLFVFPLTLVFQTS